MEPLTTQFLLSRCRLAFYGPCWHGPCLRAALAGTTAEWAVAKPLDGGHSIAELVGHLIFWQEVTCRRLGNKGTAVTPQRNFPAPAGAGQQWWKQLKSELRASQDALLAAITSLSDNDLARLTYRQSHSVGFMLAGVADHTLYHAGQISQLKHAQARTQVPAARKSRG